MSKRTAVLSLSGGMDSTCLMMHALNKGYDEVIAVSFVYGQRHIIELECAKRNIEFLKSKGFDITHKIIDLTECFSLSASSLKPENEAVPEGAYDSDVMKSTVVENRNIIFSSILFGMALGRANHTGGTADIYLGIHSGDHTIYPDCRPESRELAQQLFRISNWNSDAVSYCAPFINIDKGDVLKSGLDAMTSLNFTEDERMQVLANTNTCYSPGEDGTACGKCGSCQERLEAFSHNHLKDPVRYRE